MDDHCYIDFSFSHLNIFLRIQKLFHYIKERKKDVIQTENFDDDIQLLDFFTEEELNYFWWPTEQENEEFWDIYIKLPKEKRLEHLTSVPWDYATVFGEIGVGDYEITDCKMISNDKGRVYYYPIGFPYGGNEPLQEAIKVFGAKITAVRG
ncbi:hypothetical protein [Bacillus sp. FJAT-52991]|uniref:SMI1/KNR4 family protein n=1 Tax=Bacillus kandeliae TaxID=3129297 RepID=A0ABZ2N6N1_9BACI